MSRYSDGLTLAEARNRFFSDWGLGPNGGYDSRWVRIESKPVPFYFPNAPGRVRAARLHDLHHVATGYHADWCGEAEIAAWEIASGCGKYAWAWVLNIGALAIGCVIAPRRIFQAFKHGRRETNLYHLGFDESNLEGESVGSLRSRLRIEPHNIATRTPDVLTFAGWAALALVWPVTPLLLAVAVL